MRSQSILNGVMVVSLSLGLALGANAKQGSQQTSGARATTTTQTATQATTHPSATHQSMKKMKAEGTIVTSTKDQLEIKTANNDETFVLNQATIKPAHLAAGKGVAVWYRQVNGEKVATRVSPLSHKQAAGSSNATTNSSASAKNQSSPKSSKPGY